MARQSLTSEKPRVTQILQTLGLTKDYSNVDNFYRDRGIACHRAINLYLCGKLDMDSIDPSYKGHFEGFLKFWENHKQKELESEKHLENDDYQGTIDLVTDEETIWDFKCSKSHDPVAEIQGAGYKNLLKTDRPFFVVQLPGDGTYKLIEYKAPVELWDATWRLYLWKTKRG